MNISCLALGILVGAVAGERATPITVLTPPTGEKAYQIAGEAFVDLWQKVTGQSLDLKTCPHANDSPLPGGDLVLIGSDAVHPMVHRLILQGAIESLGIAYGTDAYRILCVPHQGHRCLVLAGGCGRSTLYAVYDFFHRQAGVEYFWDGDSIPKRSQIDFERIDVTEKPHFSYRGLRYFAHRGLHRFQAEHWDLDDWKREIDWLVKKRFNFFMLRIGIDDLFQRAFPDVPYPPTDGKDPDGVDRSYNDRTSFWPLRYRGELRKHVLQYAFDRGLLHPEDCGPLTHWYSHTPSAFLRNRPDFPVTRDQKSGYSLLTTQIWDLENPLSWEAYWQLTATHVREFGQARLFHTIGLAERTFGATPRENLQRKLYAYRKTQQILRQHYPDAPLIIAGWDFIGWWKDEDVHRLLEEFDPGKTIIFDYTADDAEKVTFRDWNLLGRFPWMFGIFHSYARNSDIHEDYSILIERLRMAAPDEKCLGLAIWSEISHSDTFLLEYLAANSWRPGEDLPAGVKRYCRSRYPEKLAEPMEAIWRNFLVTSQTLHWSHSGSRAIAMNEPQFRVLGHTFSTLTPERLAGRDKELQRFAAGLKPAPQVLSGLADLSRAWYENPGWRRDGLDMARTITNRALLVSLLKASVDMESWRTGKIPSARIEKLAELNKSFMHHLADLLALSEEYSMCATLERLRKAEPLAGIQPDLNPHTEQTLKSNAENDYCRSHHYELVRYVYQPELDVYWAWVLGRIHSQDKSPWRRPPEFSQQAKTIADRFYETPLSQMAPAIPPPDSSQTQYAQVMRGLSTLVDELLNLLAEP